MSKTSTPIEEFPPIFLPGLKLRTVSEDLVDPSATAEALKLADALLDNPSHEDVIICVKHFNPAFKLFPDQDPSLTVTYTGGIEEAESDLIDDYEVRSDDGEDDDEELEGEIVEVEADGEEGLEEAESNELDLVTKVYEKVVSSPFDGYYCFHLRVEDDWSFDQVTKALETIEVSVSVHDDGDGTEDSIGGDEMEISSGNGKTRHGSVVGEPFVIDLSDQEKDGEMAPKLFFLDWDLSDVLMRQVFSPQELQSFDNEKHISKDVLFLGAADNKQYNPLEDLKLHVNLFGRFEEGHHEDLVIKVSHGGDFVPNLKKSAVNALEDVMKGAVNQLDLVPSMISTSDSGWVTFGFSVENILQAFLARYVTEFPSLRSMSREDFEQILNPDSHKSDEEERLRSIIIDTTTSVRLSVLVEDSAGAPVSKFLLDAIESNDMYYDSAVQLLKNKDNWVEEKLIEWSTMATFSSLTDFNCLYRFAQYKLSEEESIPLSETTTGVQNHAFEVTVNLPNIEVDPRDLCMLVHQSNDMLQFQNEDPSHRFKYLTSPTVDEGGESVTFKWMSTNPTKEAGKVEMNVSLLLNTVLQGDEPRRDDHKKIGSSVSFVKQIGQGSEKHFTSLKIRKSISLGIEEVSPLEESVANFLEAIFYLVLKISGLEDSVSRSELENSSDEIGSSFHKKMLQQDNSALYSEIMSSSVFHSNPTDPDYEEEQNNIESAEVLLAMFEALLSTYSGDLRDVIRIILDEKSMKETDEYYEKEFEHFRGKFSAVFQLSTKDLASELAGFPSSKNKFLSAGRILSEEIEEFKNKDSAESFDAQQFSTSMRSSHPTGESNNVDSAYEVLVASGLKMDKGAFEEVIINPIQALDDQSRQVSREIGHSVSSFDRKIVPLSTSRGVIDRSAPSFDRRPLSTSRGVMLASMAATMEDKLMKMLNSARDSGDEVMSVMDSAQSAIEDILSPIESLEGFRLNMRSLSSKAQSLERAIRTMIPIILKIGSRCPLWPVKAIVNIIKSPLNMLKNAARRGKDSIVRLNKKVSQHLKNIMKQRSNISKSTSKLDKPKGAIDKFKEIILMLSTMAASGLLPVHLISKFIESTTLESFFNTLKSQAGSLKNFFEGFGREIQNVSRYFPSIRSLLDSISKKFSVMRPIDNLFRKLKPWVDKAVALFRRSFPWWLRWMFKVIMKPIEWTINLLLRPFKSIIRRMVDKINPFGGMGFLDTVNRYIGTITRSFSGVGSKIGEIVRLTTSKHFETISTTLANGLAIVLRAMYTLLSQAIVQGANSIEFLEDMLSGSSTISSLMTFLLNEKKSDESTTLSTVLLKIKAQKIDCPSARIDMYLKNNVSSSPYSYTDSFSMQKIRQYIRYDSSYEFVPCFLRPMDDAKTPYFERGSHYSWLTGPLAGVLHHKLLIKQAESLDFDSSNFTKLSDDFIPEVSANGKCTIRLFENFNDSNTIPTYVDTRFPVKKASLSLGSDVTNMTTDLVDFISSKVFAPIHGYFSSAQLGSCSWALLEKVVICRGASKYESIGSGVHLLTGLKTGFRYVKNGNGTWTKQNVSLAGSGFRTNEHSHFENASGQISSAAMTEHLRNCTLSMGQMNKLKLLATDQDSEDIDESTNAGIVEQIKKLSMFVVLTTNTKAHPIICHDETDEKNPLYSPGDLLQPLMDLGGVKEIWEYAIGTTTTSPSSTTTRAMSTASSSIDSSPPYTSSRSVLTDWNVAPHSSLGSDMVFGAGARSLGVVTSRTTQSSSVGDQLQNSALARAPSSTDGTPRSGKYKPGALNGIASKLIKDLADSTVSVFLEGLRPDAITKGSVVELKAIPEKSRKYKYENERNKVEGIHIVTSYPKTESRVKKIGRTERKTVKVVTLEMQKIDRPVTSKNNMSFVVKKVLVSDLQFVQDESKLHKKEVLQNLNLFPNSGVTKRQNLQFTETPERWGMTLKQFRDYITFCMGGVKELTQGNGKRSKVTLSSTWNQLKKDKTFVKDKNWVNAHDVNKAFIIPHTKGSGMGVALNMQKKPENGNTAVVMLSHAWNEDMSQVLSMLEDAKRNGLRLQSGKPLGDDTVIWFCCFANFQVNVWDNNAKKSKIIDSKGPTVSDQVALDAFEKVIQSPACVDMIVLQTTTFDPNSRFWCVVELSTALEKQRKGNFKLHYLFSKNFLKTFVKRKVVPATQKWVNNGSDEWALEGGSQSSGNFVFNSNGTAGVFKDAIQNYEMMKVDDKVVLKQEHLDKENHWKDDEKSTLNFKLGAEWSQLKYDIFFSRTKNDNEAWAKKFIDIGNDDKWREMQRTIITYQQDTAVEAMERSLNSRFVFW